MNRPALVSGAWFALGLLGGASVATWVVRPVRAVSTHADSVIRSGIDVEDLRSVLRQELPIALAASARATSSPLPSQATAEVPAVIAQPAAPISLQQRRDARQAASAIIAAGQWGTEQRLSFHEKLALLDEAEKEQAMQELVRAIDSGSIKVSPAEPFL